ncbi:MAG: hypothetical protein IPM38_12725, partial [Ignavibacteria bacterium]|nr:hypothetical protein [Ignavibacteria bacterium]
MKLIKLYALADFVSGKWNTVTTSISHIYSLLGAKKINIRDKTDSSINVETEFKKAGVSIVDFDFKSMLKRKYELNETFEESLYEPDEVKDK